MTGMMVEEHFLNSYLSEVDVCLRNKKERRSSAAKIMWYSSPYQLEYKDEPYHS